MFKRLFIWYWKRRARSAYISYCGLNSDLDCGYAMQETVRPGSAARRELLAVEFDMCVAHLARLGESVPETRLSSYKGKLLRDM